MIGPRDDTLSYAAPVALLRELGAACQPEFTPHNTTRLRHGWLSVSRLRSLASAMHLNFLPRVESRRYPEWSSLHERCSDTVRRIFKTPFTRVALSYDTEERYGEGVHYLNLYPPFRRSNISYDWIRYVMWLGLDQSENHPMARTVGNTQDIGRDPIQDSNGRTKQSGTGISLKAGKVRLSFCHLSPV